MSETYRLLIGSVGDDSHSVGMSLLTIAFREAGFFVRNLGILNVLDDFFSIAANFDAILISCMNGHADLYLEDFPAKLSLYNLSNRSPKLWYLGGNLSVKDNDETIIRKYLGMGFHYVASKPVAVETIMENLLRDLHNHGIKKRKLVGSVSAESQSIPMLDTINDSPLSDDAYLAIRAEVLGSWPTGEEVLITDVAANHANVSKNLHRLIRHNLMNGAKPLVQPRTGVAHTDDEIAILKYLREKGLDVSSIQLDAASRKKMFDRAREGVCRTEKGKTSFLNGYPIPVHGVKGVEEILRAIDTPFQIRAGSPDHRMVYEIGLAGGASSVEGGFLCYLYPYDKHTSPVESLMYWKYVDKLTEWYARHHSVVINREYFGPLTCCLIEPSIPICINIVEAILSAKSGVKCISVGLAEQGNRCQDIAAIRVLANLTRSYLTDYGCSDCTVSTVYHQYMAAFPTDVHRARDLIMNSSTTGALAGATRLMTKTPVESIHIPTKEDNADGLLQTRIGIQKAEDTIVAWDVVQNEMRLIEREVKAIMRSIQELGRGSLARGAIRAFQKGILDIPFSPSNYNRNQLITVKDCDGAIRFFNPELLPLPEEIADFHREKVHRRMTMERLSKVSEMLEKDLTRIWKNDYLRWPLDGTYVC